MNNWMVKIGNDYFVGFGPNDVVWTAWFDKDAERYTNIEAQQIALKLIKLGYVNVAYGKAVDYERDSLHVR